MGALEKVPGKQNWIDHLPADRVTYWDFDADLARINGHQHALPKEDGQKHHKQERDGDTERVSREPLLCHAQSGSYPPS